MKLGEAFAGIARAFEHRDLGELKTLAGTCCEEALRQREALFVDAGAMAYALAKFAEKGHVVQARDWSAFAERAAIGLDRLAASTGGEREALEEEVRHAVFQLREFGAQMGRFTTNAVDKAFLKCGAQLYAHGASLGKAAELARVDFRDLANYVSATKLADKYGTVPVAERLSRARRALGGA